MIRPEADSAELGCNDLIFIYESKLDMIREKIVNSIVPGEPHSAHRIRNNCPTQGAVNPDANIGLKC